MTPRRAIAAVFALVLVATTARAQTHAWPSEGPPRPLAARDVKFPPYEIRTLPNGLQVVAVLHHEQPVVSIRLIVRAGSASDPKDKLGLAHLAASLLDQGTTKMSAEEIADAVDFIGGAEGTGAGTDLSFLNMIVMKDSFDTGMRMLSDMARHPSFAPPEIDRQRQQTLSGLRVSQEDPSYIADAVFDRMVYGFHPYGLPQSGTPETIAAITRDDLVQFHQRYFAPNNAIIAVVGDVTADEAFDETNKVFGDWERRDVPVATVTDPPEASRRVVVIDKPDAVQTEVRVGQIGIARTNADYMAVNLAIRILGGEGSNRLHQVLRTERGLTYGAQADMNSLKRAGDFEAQTNTRSEETGEVLRLMVDEFWRLQREPVGQHELGDAKAYLTGSFPLTIETPDAIATQVLNQLFYDLPLKQLETFRERVNTVTVDDIQRVAKGYLRPDSLAIVLVGNASAFSSQLRGVGFGKFETVRLNDLDLTAADFKRSPAHAGENPAADLNATGSRRALHMAAANPTEFSYQSKTQQSRITAKEGPAAMELVDKAIAAKGGLDRLRALRTITAVSTTKMYGAPNAPADAASTTYLEYPNRFRVDTTLPDVMYVQVFDGEHAWVRDPAGTHDVPAPGIAEIQASLKRDTVTLLLAAHDGKIQARSLPDVKETSGEIDHAIELTGPGLEPLIMYISPATSFVTKQTYVAGMPGQPLIEESFGDYRAVDGVQIAHLATIRRGGQVVLERRVTEVTINAPINSSLFKRPTT